MIHVGKRTRALGIVLAASGLFLFAVGYSNYRRLERERAQLGEIYNMMVRTDLYTPRTTPLFKTALLLFGVTGLATLGSVLIDVRDTGGQR